MGGEGDGCLGSGADRRSGLDSSRGSLLPWENTDVPGNITRIPAREGPRGLRDDAHPGPTATSARAADRRRRPTRARHERMRARTRSRFLARGTAVATAAAIALAGAVVPATTA